MTGPDLSVETMQKDLLTLLNLWNTLTDAHPLAYLWLARPGPSQSAAARIKEVVGELIDDLDDDSKKLLRLRFFNERSAHQTAHALSIAESSVFRKQRQILEQMAGALYARETRLRRTQQSRFVARLEVPTYARLFGAEQQVSEILALLAQDGPPWLVLVQGIGGIGKTSLADATMRRAIETGAFGDFGWVTARRNLFRLDGSIWPATAPALSPDSLLERLAGQLLDEPLPSPFSFERVLGMLQAHMGTTRHLVVVDNLETVSDLHVLLPALRRLANPSKILITSRESLAAEPSIYPLRVRPLDEPDALALVRHEAGARNLPQLAQADESALRPIYATVGGNPLALRLVVGQSSRHPLATVLDDLRMARGRTVEHLYTFLYRRIWDDLDESERDVLLAMPLTPENGSDLDYLSVVSEMDVTRVHDALERLIGLNVVDYRGDLQQSRYTIHSLTRTFLLEQVIRWQDEEGL